MPKRTFATALPLVAALFVGACSSSSTNTGGPGGDAGAATEGGTSTSSLPDVCPIFTADLAAKASTKALQSTTGEERAVGRVKQCSYRQTGGAFSILGQIGPSDGPAATYKEQCPTSVVPGKVVEGVGTWACFRGDDAKGGVLSTGNDTYEIGVSGDVPLATLEEVGKAFLAKLPH